MNHKRCNLVIIIFLSMIGLTVNCTAKEYKWSELKKKDEFVTFLGSYQDYWIDWSPDSNKVVALSAMSGLGIQVIDLSRCFYEENDYGFMLPTKLEKGYDNPFIWYSITKDKPIHQGAPTWSGKDNIIAYIEFDKDFEQSSLKLYDLSLRKMETKKFRNILKIKGIDFSWNKYLLAIYSDNNLLIWDYNKDEIVKKWKAPEQISQVSWFPDDEHLLITYSHKAAYKISLTNDLKPELFLENAHYGNCSFVPNTTKIVVGSRDGLVLYDYQTGSKKLITKGFAYQPQVSPDGKFVAYIAESPYYGGFIAPIR